VGEHFELDLTALRTVTAGFAASAAALDAAVTALRSRDERFSRPVRVWAEATRSNADRLERTMTEYARQERENVGTVGGADR
jgi:hypothetical protein